MTKNQRSNFPFFMICKAENSFNWLRTCTILYLFECVQHHSNHLRRLHGYFKVYAMVCEEGSNSKSPPRMQQVANAIFCSNSSSSIQNLIKVVCPQPHSQMKQLPDNREQDMERGYSLLPTPDTRKTNHTKLYHIETPKEHSNNPEAYHIVEQFKNSVCSVCNNRRSKFEPLKEFTYTRLHDATKGFSLKIFFRRWIWFCLQRNAAWRTQDCC